MVSRRLCPSMAATVQVHGFDQATRRVVAEPVRMDVGHISTTTEDRQWDHPLFVAFAFLDRGLPGARLQFEIRPRQVDELVYAQTCVQQSGDDGIHHGPGSFGFAAQPLAFEWAEPLGCQWLAGDWLEFGCGI